MILVPLTACYQSHNRKKSHIQNVRSSKLEISETPILEIIYTDIFLNATSDLSTTVNDNKIGGGKAGSKSDIVIMYRGKILQQMSVY